MTIKVNELENRNTDGYIKGRGSQIRTKNRFEKKYYEKDAVDGIDSFEIVSPKTQLFYESPKDIVSKNNSPDLNFTYSINPYQGCEHGCTYCYARNSHEFWGFSAGLDFESKIVVKKTAAELLEKKFLTKGWKPAPIMLSGNTDCYQPIEKKLKLTRELLQIFEKYQNPVSIITKNSLVERDIDIIKSLAEQNLVKVIITINSLDEKLRSKMEPRTASTRKKLNTIKLLAKNDIPVGVMIAPIIPGLNHHEIPEIMKVASNEGASFASYTTIRLNGAIGELFKDWLDKNYPDRAEKVWNQIGWLHQGKVQGLNWGERIKGSGDLALSIQNLFNLSVKKYMSKEKLPAYDLTKFRKGGNYTLF
jgi:DNA repair photolyase